MELNKKELLSALKKIAPGIAKKAIMEQMSHSIFTGKYVISYNSQVSVLIPFETEFQCSVNADDFTKIVKKIRETDIKLKKTKNGLVVNVPGTKALLMTPLGDELSIHLKTLTDEIPKKGKAVPENFNSALSACAFAASKNEGSGAMTCIRISEDNMFSCDGVRASHVKLTHLMPDFMIRAKSVEGLIEFDPTGYHISKSWVHFTNEKDEFYNIRLVNGIYPDKTVMGLFEVTGGHALNLPMDLKDIVTDIKIMTEGPDIAKVIEIVIDNKMIICTAEKETGNIEKRIPIEYDGGRISFLINPVFLSQILEKLNVCTYSDEKILFNNKNTQHVIALKTRK